LIIQFLFKKNKVQGLMCIKMNENRLREYLFSDELEINCINIEKRC